MTKMSQAAPGSNIKAFERLCPIEYRDPNDLKLYARNPRKHP